MTCSDELDNQLKQETEEGPDDLKRNMVLRSHETPVFLFFKSCCLNFIEFRYCPITIFLVTRFGFCFIIHSFRVSNASPPSTKAATIIVLFATGGYRRKRSSSSEGSANPESLLLAAVGRLDTHGCVLKLLCQLEAESPDALSPEERIFAAVFADRLELFAKDSGAAEERAGDGQVCEASGDRCPLEGDLLRGLLRRVWSSYSG